MIIEIYIIIELIVGLWSEMILVFHCIAIIFHR